MPALAVTTSVDKAILALARTWLAWLAMSRGGRQDVHKMEPAGHRETLDEEPPAALRNAMQLHSTLLSRLVCCHPLALPHFMIVLPTVSAPCLSRTEVVLYHPRSLRRHCDWNSVPASLAYFRSLQDDPYY